MSGWHSIIRGLRNTEFYSSSGSGSMRTGSANAEKLTNTEKDYVMTECEKENLTLSFRSRELLQQQFPEQQQQQLPEANSSEIRSPKGAKALKLG